MIIKKRSSNIWMSVEKKNERKWISNQLRKKHWLAILNKNKIILPPQFIRISTFSYNK